MIKDKKTAFVIYVVLFIVLWNLADLIWNTVISGGGYDFAVGMDIGTPLVVALVTGYLFFLAQQVSINDELDKTD